jgi:SAM-dependent methyltransferase
MKNFIRGIIRPLNKQSIIFKVRPKKILLVGCGNGELDKLKKIYNCKIVGIDITPSNIIFSNDEIITASTKFHKTILSLEEKFDLIISSHNLEHCNYPIRTLFAMCEKLSNNGIIYLSWPSPHSLLFPKRNGTLNFYDDPTHINILHPELIKKILLRKKILIIKNINGYKPIIGFIIGIIIEPISKMINKTFSYTWDFYGFEAIIIGKKIV